MDKSTMYCILILQCLIAIVFCDSLFDNSNYESFKRSEKIENYRHNQQKENKPFIMDLLVRKKRQLSFGTQSGTTLIDCIRNCPATAEYNPVCGSDGQQYSNPGKLSCSAHCSKSAIRIRYYGRCEYERRR